MATWAQLEQEHPALTQAARERLDRFRHKLLGTLRADGSPRISGTELTFAGDHVWFGSMPGSRKAADLRRDPRCTIHSGSPDPNPEDQTDWDGDAKLSGRAIEVTDADERAPYLTALAEQHPEMELDDGAEDAAPPFDLFRIEIEELVVIEIGEPADHLDIRVWTATGGDRTYQRH